MILKDSDITRAKSLEEVVRDTMIDIEIEDMRKRGFSDVEILLVFVDAALAGPPGPPKFIDLLRGCQPADINSQRVTLPPEKPSN